MLKTKERLIVINKDYANNTVNWTLNLQLLRNTIFEYQHSTENNI